MRIFLTGGTGFIGRNLKEQLAGRHEIFAPSSSELDLLDADAVSKYVAAGRFDVAIHSATWNATRTSSKDLARVLDCNLRMFFNLARCNSDYGRMLYYGSGAEFDRLHWRPVMGEDYFDRHVPTDDYGFSKYIMAKHSEKSENIYNLRLFGVFGKYEDWQIRFISNACCKAVYGLPITIKQNVVFDYLHVNDLVKITERFIDGKPASKVYNVCTQKTHDLLTLAGMVLDAAGKNSGIRVTNEGMGREYSGRNSRLMAELGGYRFRDMRECIFELYNWYMENKNLIDKDKLLSDR